MIKNSSIPNITQEDLKDPALSNLNRWLRQLSRELLSSQGANGSVVFVEDVTAPDIKINRQLVADEDNQVLTLRDGKELFSVKAIAQAIQQREQFGFRISGTSLAPGSITGPVSSTDSGVALWDGVTGNKLKDSVNFVVDGSGNVSIGSVTPGLRLDLTSPNNNGVRIRNSSNANKIAAQLLVNGGDFGELILYDSAEAAGAYISGTGTVASYILSKLGIGKSAPTLALELRCSNNNGFRIENSSNSNKLSSQLLTNGGDFGELILYDSAEVSRAYIAGSSTADNYVMGALGIGTTTPAQSLHVYDTTRYNGVVIGGNVSPSLSFRPTSGAMHIGQIFQDGNNIHIASDGVGEKVTIDMFWSRVGIGTTAPLQALHVFDTTRYKGIQIGGNQSPSLLFYPTSGATHWGQVFQDTNKIHFASDGVGVRATLDIANTRLGVGNDSPTYTLDVSGDINTTGIYRISGTQIAASNLSNGTTGSGSIVLATSPTITTPTIASFANANHGHTDSAGGGTLSASAIGSGTLAMARVGKRTRSIAVKTADYTIQTGDDIIMGKGAITITLPQGSTVIGEEFTFVKGDATGTTVVACYGSEVLYTGSGTQNFTTKGSGFMVTWSSAESMWIAV